MRGALLGAEEPLCFLACGLSIKKNVWLRCTVQLATFFGDFFCVTDGRIDFQW
jgi:hypothetical protein